MNVLVSPPSAVQLETAVSDAVQSKLTSYVTLAQLKESEERLTSAHERTVHGLATAATASSAETAATIDSLQVDVTALTASVQVSLLNATARAASTNCDSSCDPKVVTTTVDAHLARYEALWLWQ